MDQSQHLGVQCLPREAAQCCNEFGGSALGYTGSATVERIADQGVAPVRHVNGSGGSPGFQIDGDAGVVAKPAGHPVVGYSRFTPGSQYRHFLAQARVAPHGRIHRTPAVMAPMQTAQYSRLTVRACNCATR